MVFEDLMVLKKQTKQKKAGVFFGVMRVSKNIDDTKGPSAYNTNVPPPI